MQFESSTEKRIKRDQLREARQQVLEQAKSEYDRQQRREEQRKARGEDTWILPAIDKRLDQDKKEYDRAHKKHKKEKKKHKKKHKKLKKSKHEKSSGSDSDSEEEPMWIEKHTVKPEADAPTTVIVKGPVLQRDDWMTSPLDLIPTVSRQEIRDQKKKESESAVDPNLLEQPGQHKLELNPYWKDGGTGLPEEDSSATWRQTPKPSARNVNDGGSGWLRKAYDRCVKTAKEEGRPLEEVAAERYGSLEKLKRMLSEAEGNTSTGNTDRPRSMNDDRRHRHQDYRSSDREFEKTDRHKDTYRSDRKTDRDNTDRHRDRKQDDDRYRDSKRESRSFESKESEQNSKYRHSDNDRRRDSHAIRTSNSDRGSLSSGSRLKGLFMKPGDSESSSSSNFSGSSRTHSDRKSASSGWRKPAFQKPSDHDSSDSPRRDRHHKEREIPERKDEKKSRFLKPSDGSTDESKSGQQNYVPNWKKKEFIEQTENSKSPKRKQSGDSGSSCSDSDSDSASDSDEKSKPKSSPPPPRVLTEKEMNQLGAKIVRAELMGNTALAEKLKTELEAARKVAASKPAGGASTGQNPSSQKDEKEAEEVVLTRTDRSGMVRPLPARQHPEEPRQGRRRKKEKVATHDSSGRRMQYFHDDDKFNLKSLVEREKSSTAEDSNMMFARLAGRSVEKTDSDYQLDDMFLSRASKKQSDSRAEDREKALAVGEHQRMAKALQKCPHCFENVPKHLIIAIGVKVYMCLPDHRSLTDGHCLIVPMQHVQSGTAVDEDVWEEIQMFRKTLVKMFEAQEEDVVFMETSMHLQRLPHMTLECVPVPREVGDMAPIYFKKAMMECDTEWAQNKRVVDLSQKDVRRAVPKGFPYFAVDFGLQGGYAHAIEDEKIFTTYFGREIIGGMLDLEPQLWRRPKKEGFEDQRQKVLRFSEWWKPFDWTLKLKSDDD